MNKTTLLNTLVAQIMTEDVITVNGNDSLHKVKDIFDNNNINHLPVIGKDKSLIGIISKKDLLLLLDWGTNKGLKSSEVRNNFLLDSNLAEDLMIQNMVTVSPSDTLSKCSDILLTNKFHALPVVEDGKLKGLVTTFDMLMMAYGN